MLIWNQFKASIVDSDKKAQWSGKYFIELPEKQFLLPIVMVE
jgi:hypothetical protein